MGSKIFPLEEIQRGNKNIYYFQQNMKFYTDCRQIKHQTMTIDHTIFIIFSFSNKYESSNSNYQPTVH